MSEPVFTATSTEVERNFRLWQDRAQQQPISVTRNGRPKVVIVAAEEYQRLKRRDRQALRVEELDEATLKALYATEPPDKASLYDHEVT